jgi:hypothetical protein
MLGLDRDGAAGRVVERAVGERNGVAGGKPAGVSGPELVEGPKRRRFSAGYKLRILREADACSRPGEVGALLRREGLRRDQVAVPAGAIGAVGQVLLDRFARPSRARPSTPASHLRALPPFS